MTTSSARPIPGGHKSSRLLTILTCTLGGGAGFDYQQICQVEPGQIYCSSSSVDTAYSPCPREWKMYNLNSQGTVLLVPF